MTNREHGRASFLIILYSVHAEHMSIITVLLLVVFLGLENGYKHIVNLFKLLLIVDGFK